VLAGVNLWSHLKSFQKFERVNSEFMVSFADVIFARSAGLRTAVVAVGLVFSVWYLLYYYYCRLSTRGYRTPMPKLVLYLVTAFVSVASGASAHSARRSSS
jgi:hypothetical protein